MSFSPDEVYALLDSGGGIRRQPGGHAFWSQPQADLDALGQDWLESEFACDGDWGDWGDWGNCEMDLEGDEFVYLLDGDIEFHLGVGASASRRLHGGFRDLVLDQDEPQFVRDRR